MDRQAPHGPRARRPDAARLYDYTLARAAAETPPEKRTSALYVLAALAGSCGVERAALERDTVALVGGAWGPCGRGRPVTAAELVASWAGYRTPVAEIGLASVESALGWSYDQPVRRRDPVTDDLVGRLARDPLASPSDLAAAMGVSRSAVLARWEDACARAARRPHASAQLIAGALVDDPRATQAAVCASTGLAPSTVRTHWDEAVALAGAGTRA